MLMRRSWRVAQRRQQSLLAVVVVLDEPNGMGLRGRSRRSLPRRGGHRGGLRVVGRRLVKECLRVSVEPHVKRPKRLQEHASRLSTDPYRPTLGHEYVCQAHLSSEDAATQTDVDTTEFAAAAGVLAVAPTIRCGLWFLGSAVATRRWGS
jgi:hypothetical protein